MKAITKGLKKSFKAVTDSGFGKSLLLAATVYTGGAALGLWDGPFNGMLSWANEAKSESPVEGAAAPASAPMAAESAPQGAASAAESFVQSQTGEALTPAPSETQDAAPAIPQGEKSFLWLINNDVAKLGLMQAGGGILSGAFKPSAGQQAGEVADQQLRMESEQRAAVQPNFNVNAQLPTPNAQPLRRMDGAPAYGGLINQNMRRA